MESLRSRLENGMKRVRELVRRGEKPPGIFSRDHFIDRLSEFLEHERNGVKLYELGLEKEMSPERHDRLHEFLEETQRHVEVLTTIMRALGADPDQLSQAAELDREKGRALLDADAGDRGALLDYFQNLMVAELVDRANWDFLETVRRNVDDEEIGPILDAYVEEIRNEEDEHFRWAEAQVEELGLDYVFGGTPEGAEEMGPEDLDEGEEGIGRPEAA
jgi:Domain of unknown function (DUF892)